MGLALHGFITRFLPTLHCVMTLKEDKYSALSAHLDYYSDRATAHASIFIAFVFGLFAVLGIAQNASNVERWLLLILSWVVWTSGLYCLLNFGFYAFLASRTRYAIRGDLVLPFKEFKDKTVKDLSIIDIDNTIHMDLVVNWRWNIIRGYLFLGLFKTTKIYELYKDWKEQPTKKQSVTGISRMQARMEVFYLIYWLIFALASTAIFGNSFVFQIWNLEFWNVAFLIASGLLIVLDLFRIPKWIMTISKSK